MKLSFNPPQSRRDRDIDTIGMESISRSAHLDMGGVVE